MPNTLVLTNQALIQTLLATEQECGELACGPNFILDLKLFTSAPSESNSIASLYEFVRQVYTEYPIAEAHFKSLMSTIDRDQNSEYWNVSENIRELTSDEFLDWFKECALAEEYYESETPDESPYPAHQSRILELSTALQGRLFGSQSTLPLYVLTDVNNENTPYGVYVAIGQTHRLLLVTHWIL